MAVPKILNRTIPRLSVTLDVPVSYVRETRSAFYSFQIDSRAQTKILSVKRGSLSGDVFYWRFVQGNGAGSVDSVSNDITIEIKCAYCGKTKALSEEIKTVKNYFNFWTTSAYVYGISWNMIERASREDGTLDTNRYEPPTGWYIIPEAFVKLDGERFIVAIANPETGRFRLIKMNSITQESQSNQYAIVINEWQPKIDLLYDSATDKIYASVIQNNQLRGYVFNANDLSMTNSYNIMTGSLYDWMDVRVIEPDGTDKMRVALISSYGETRIYNATGLEATLPERIVSVKNGYLMSRQTFFDNNLNALYTNSDIVNDFHYDESTQTLFLITQSLSSSPFMAELWKVDLTTYAKTRLGSLTISNITGEQWFGKIWQDMSGYLLAGTYTVTGKKVVKKFDKVNTGQDTSISV